MLACMEGYYPNVKRLLSWPGIQIDIRDSRGETALMMACHVYWINKELFTLLLEKGANPRLKNLAGKNALTIAKDYNSNAIKAIEDFEAAQKSASKAAKKRASVSCQYSLYSKKQSTSSVRNHTNSNHTHAKPLGM